MLTMLRCVTGSWAVAAIMVLAVAAPAAAQMGDVSIGGVWVCRLTRGIGPLSLEERVVEIERRIVHVLSTPKYRGAGVGVTLRPTGLNTEIVVGETVIMTVTTDDAAGTSLPTREVARQWAVRLVKGMNQALPDARFHVF
jgi:hypothetical protein